MNKAERAQVGRRIQQLMKRVGITQKGLADYLNISQPAISLYLQGRIPPADVLLRIARLANTTVEWILTGEEDHPREMLAVKENQVPYGKESVLLELWSQLPQSARSDFLNLLKRFVEISKR